MDIGSIGSRIKALRTAVKISQEELADSINVSRGNVGDWERGRAKPGAEALISLSRYFNVSVDWILTGREFESREDARIFVQSVIEASPEELELLAKIKQLSDKDRGKIEGYIDALIGSYRQPQTKNSIRSSTLTNGEEAAAKDAG